MSCLKIVMVGVLLVALFIPGLIGGSIWWFHDASAPVQIPQGSEVCFRIKPGMTTKAIANTLKQAGLIRSTVAFTQLVSFYGVGNRLRPGDFVFQGTVTQEDIIQQLLAGYESGIKVTIPEGSRLVQIARILATHGICSATSFLDTVSSPDVIDDVFAQFGALPSAEGLVFPETYIFRKSESPRVVVATMLRLGRHKIETILGQAPDDFGLTLYQRCVLASIVEREAKLDSDRPKVASVFLNRLKKGMRLESCATVQYALPNYKKRLTYEDLKVKSPYNTYIHTGLPPTPISNFGEASLKAVTHPEQTDFLYFVSDAEGGHHFSKSLKEHERYRRKFFQKRKRGKASR